MEENSNKPRKISEAEWIYGSAYIQFHEKQTILENLFLEMKELLQKGQIPTETFIVKLERGLSDIKLESIDIMVGLREFEKTKQKNLENEELDIKDSDIKDSDIKDSDIKDSDIKDSDIKDSDIKDSDIKDSDIKDSDIKDSDIKD
jgi:uncharacterized protein YjbI with pentapeptide repeats